MISRITSAIVDNSLILSVEAEDWVYSTTITTTQI